MREGVGQDYQIQKEIILLDSIIFKEIAFRSKTVEIWESKCNFMNETQLDLKHKTKTLAKETNVSLWCVISRTDVKAIFVS